MANGDTDPADAPHNPLEELLPEEEEALRELPDSADFGNREAIELGQGLTAKQIKARALQREADRTEKFRDQFELVARVALWIAFGALVAVGLIWLWHLLAVERLHWLTPEQVEKVQNIVTGGVVAGVVATHLKRRLN